MKRIRTLLTLIPAVSVALALLPAPASSQEASPSPTMERAAFVVSPDECTREPRQADELAMLATPAADVPPPPDLVGDGPFAAPDGVPADAATATAVTEAIRGSWACTNGNDWARFFAYLTTEDIQQSFPPEDIAYLSSLPVEPLPVEEQTAIFAILDVEVLDDGRVGAFVVMDTAGDPIPVEINYQIAVETEDGWMLDDFICFAADGDPCGAG